MQASSAPSTHAISPDSARLRPLQPVNPLHCLPRGAVLSAPSSSSSSSSMGSAGSQVVPVEPYLRWDVAVSRRFLSSVDRVEIHESREHGGTTFFVVDVFLTLPETRLPMASAASVSSPTTASPSTPGISADAVKDERAPTYQIERRYSAFGRLRETLEQWVHESTPLCRCAYCVELVEYLRFSWTQPSLLTKLMYRGDARRELLATFLNDMIAFARRPPTSPTSVISHRRPAPAAQATQSGRTRTCKVQAHVPSLLEAFLLDKGHQ